MCTGKSWGHQGTANELPLHDRNKLVNMCSEDLRKRTKPHVTEEGEDPHSPCQSDLGGKNSFLVPYLVIGMTQKKSKIL